MCYKIKIEDKSYERLKFYFYIISSRDLYPINNIQASIYRLEKYHIIKEKINTKLNLKLRRM
jgi:hypothetical protein